MKRKYKPLMLATYEIVNGQPAVKLSAEDKKGYIKKGILVSCIFLSGAFVLSSSSYLLASEVGTYFFLFLALLSFCAGCFAYISGDMISIDWTDERFRYKFDELKAEFKQVEGSISIEEFSAKVLEMERRERKANAEKILKKYGIDGND
ncbi:hypothetical protein [Neisseria weixii]|uniref:hypothetical protein n=1 Tax=Neisseria weixii TaxID=1853276 RepID=UPI00359FAD45